MLAYLSYRKKWYLLWLFDLLTVGAWAFFLYKNPSPMGKSGDASANAMFYMMLYGFLRAAWLFVLTIIAVFRKKWGMGLLSAFHAAMWYMLGYVLICLFAGATGGH